MNPAKGSKDSDHDSRGGQDHVRIEVEDAGGSWGKGRYDDGRPDGFDVVAAIAGAGNWGTDGDDGGRVAWARLGG